MKQERISNTGFNPTLQSFLGTSNESVFCVETADSNSLASVMKNEQLITEVDVIYIMDDIN